VCWRRVRRVAWDFRNEWLDFIISGRRLEDVRETTMVCEEKGCLGLGRQAM
jgi:hypothetical protein